MLTFNVPYICAAGNASLILLLLCVKSHIVTGVGFVTFLDEVFIDYALYQGAVCVMSET